MVTLMLKTTELHDDYDVNCHSPFFNLEKDGDISSMLVGDSQLAHEDETPFKFIKDDLFPPKVTMSIDLTEYVNTYFLYIKDTESKINKQNFEALFHRLSEYLKEIYTSFYLSNLIEIFLKDDIQQIEKVKDTFLYHYLSGFFIEIIKNTIDERIQKYFELKEFLLASPETKIVACLEFRINYPDTNKINFEIIDKYSRGFPLEFLPKINNPEVRELYLSKKLKNSHYKQRDCLALALFSVLDEIEFRLLKDLIPEFLLPNNQKLKDIVNYKDIIFIGSELRDFLELLESLSLEKGSNKSQIQNIVIKLNYHPNISRVLFGGEGCGLRQIAEIFFKHADLRSTGGLSAIAPSFVVRKRRREPSFSHMEIINETNSGAKIILTTSLESFLNTVSNPPSEAVSPGINLSSIGFFRNFNKDGSSKFNGMDVSKKGNSEISSPVFQESLSRQPSKSDIFESIPLSDSMTSLDKFYNP